MIWSLSLVVCLYVLNIVYATEVVNLFGEFLKIILGPVLV